MEERGDSINRLMKNNNIQVCRIALATPGLLIRNTFPMGNCKIKCLNTLRTLYFAEQKLLFRVSYIKTYSLVRVAWPIIKFLAFVLLFGSKGQSEVLGQDSWLQMCSFGRRNKIIISLQIKLNMFLNFLTDAADSMTIAMKRRKKTCSPKKIMVSHFLFVRGFNFIYLFIFWKSNIYFFEGLQQVF